MPRCTHVWPPPTVRYLCPSSSHSLLSIRPRAASTPSLHPTVSTSATSPHRPLFPPPPPSPPPSPPPHPDMSAFGIGIGLYFTSVMWLGIMSAVCGGIAMMTTLYYNSHDYLGSGAGFSTKMAAPIKSPGFMLGGYEAGEGAGGWEGGRGVEGRQPPAISPAPSLPRSLAPSRPYPLAPSLPPALNPSTPRSITPSLPRSRPPASRLAHAPVDNRGSAWCPNTEEVCLDANCASKAVKRLCTVSRGQGNTHPTRYQQPTQASLAALPSHLVAFGFHVGRPTC